MYSFITLIDNNCHLPDLKHFVTVVCIVGSKTLYVARAQKKVEREQILRHQFEEKRKEQLLKYKVVLCPFLSLYLSAFVCLFILSLPPPPFSPLIVQLHMWMGLEPTTSSSTLIIQGEEVPFKVEVIVYSTYLFSFFNL